MKEKLLRMAELSEKHEDLCKLCSKECYSERVVKYYSGHDEYCEKITFCSDWEEEND